MTRLNNLTAAAKSNSIDRCNNGLWKGLQARGHRLAHALNKMSIGGFRHVPAVDDEHWPRRVVSVKDIVDYVVEAFPREVLNLPVGKAAQQAREGA